MVKTALVTSGGGLRCSWGAGATYFLATEADEFSFDIVIGASGSTGTDSYYVAGQPDSIKRIWCDLLSSDDFVNFFRLSKIMDIDYLIDTIFREQEPLDVESLYGSETEYYIAVTHAVTGHLTYLPINNRVTDIFEAMRASKKLPIASGFQNTSTSIEGVPYRDSHISSHVELNIEKAIEMGAQRILVIDTSSSNVNRVFSKFNPYNFWLQLQNADFRRAYKLYEKKQNDFTLPDDISCYMLEPSDNLRIGRLRNNAVLLEESFQQGYEQARNDINLANFLNL